MHTGREGMAAMPYFDDFDLGTVDILLISQYVFCFPLSSQMVYQWQWRRCSGLQEQGEQDASLQQNLEAMNTFGLLLASLLYHRFEAIQFCSTSSLPLRTSFPTPAYTFCGMANLSTAIS